jgi:ABC-type transporter Mla subunit MlaD
MRIALAILALAATGFLAACNSEEACTAEVAQKKATDLAAKITEIGAADPAKLAELTPQLQDLTAKAAAGGDDLAATCKAIDDMMATLAN